MRNFVFCLALLSANIAFAQDANTLDEANTLAQVKLLKTQGDLTGAQALAKTYLNQYPNDPDMQLLLGAIYYQEKDYTSAKEILNTAIKNYPDYKDLSDLLAQVKKAEIIDTAEKQTPPPTVKKMDEKETLAQVKSLKQAGKTQEAKSLALKYLDEYPNDPDMQLLLASIYYQEKNYAQAKALLKTGLKNYPQYKELTELLTHVENAENQIAIPIAGAMSAQIGSGLYAGNIEERKNHLIFYQQSLYSTSPDGYWDFTSLYYVRDTDWGNLLSAINFASRNEHDSAQGQLGSTVKLNKDIYVVLNTTYADNLYIYPRYTLQGEIYFNIFNLFEFSIGDNYENISFTHFNAYTASIQKEIGMYGLGLRTYYFVPEAGSKTNYYIGNFQRFIDDEKHFVALTAGYGTTPDLADLQSVDFITVQDKLLGLNYERPLIEDALSLNVGVSYEYQKYSIGFVRQLTGLNFILKTAF